MKGSGIYHNRVVSSMATVLGSHITSEKSSTTACGMGWNLRSDKAQGGGEGRPDQEWVNK